MRASLQDPPSDLANPSPVRAASAARLEDEVIGLFDHFQEPLLRYLIAMGLSPADGEEIAQEVFLALFDHLRLGKPRDNLRGWIFRVAHNLGLKRRKKTRQQSENAPERGNLRLDGGVDRNPNPEELFLYAERRSRLRAVVRALPERDRWCLYLRAEGLRYREIARVLGISLGSVSLRLGRSLTRLARVEAE